MCESDRERVAGVREVETVLKIGEVSTTGMIRSCEGEAGVHEGTGVREITIQKRA